MSGDSPAAILFDVNGNPVTVITGSLSTVNLSSTGTITSVTAVNVDTLLLAANPDRRGAFIYNDTSSATLKIGFSTSTVTTTNFSVELTSGGVFEIPFGYTGMLRGLWSVNEPAGAARITEMT